MNGRVIRALGLELFTRKRQFPLIFVSRQSVFIVFFFGLAVGCLLALLVFAYYPDTTWLFDFISQMEAHEYIWLLGILLATIGWIATVTTTRYLSRRQHTINVLLQHRFNDYFHKHLSTVTAHFPVGTIISKSDAEALFSSVKKKANNDPLREVYESIVPILNYYEFLAVGITRGDLNENVMRDFYKSMVCNFCEKTHEFIKHAQKDQPTGCEHLIELYKIWRRTDRFPNPRFIRKAATVPQIENVP